MQQDIEQQDTKTSQTFEQFCDIDLENTTATEISTHFFEQFLSSSKKGRVLERDTEILYMLITNEDILEDYTHEDICMHLFKKSISSEVNLSDEDISEYVIDHNNSLIGVQLQDKITHSLINLLPKAIRSYTHYRAEDAKDLRENLSDLLGSVHINYEYSILESSLPYQELSKIKSYYLRKFNEILKQELSSSEENKSSYNQNPRAFIQELITRL